VAGKSIELAPAPTATQGSVTLSAGGADCTYSWGSVVVHELVVDADATSVLAADVSGTCGTVQARVGATTPWSGLSVPGSTDVGAVDLLGFVAQDVVVRVTGTSSVSFRTASVPEPVSPDDFPDFGVVVDGCEGRTGVPDSSCTVTVGFSPWEAGPRSSTLLLPDTTSSGATRVSLTGTGTTNSTGTYVGLRSPKRLLDTRVAGTRTPLAGGSTTRLQVAGRAGVPASGVSAVVLNLTAVDTTLRGYFTLYPDGRKRPTASSINFPQGWTGANMVTVPVGADGKVALYNAAGRAHAVVDVLGSYWKDGPKPLGSQLLPLGDSERLFDSRLDGGRLAGGEDVDLAGILGGPRDTVDISEFVVYVTAVGATHPGVLTVWSGVGTRPKASSVNYEPQVVAPNMVIVSAGQAGQGAGFRISNTSSGSVHVVVDLVAIHVKDSPFGLRFTPRAAPTRFLDTRNGTGLRGAFGAGQTRTVNGSGVSTRETYGIVANTTGITPTRQTFLSTWSGEEGSTRTDASLLNVAPGAVRSASTYAMTTETHRFKLYNAAGSVHVAMDAAGTLDAYARLVDTIPLATGAARTTADAGGLPSVRGFGGRELRAAATLEHVTSRVTRR
jgi:hypothetical protein